MNIKNVVYMRACMCLCVCVGGGVWGGVWMAKQHQNHNQRFISTQVLTVGLALIQIIQVHIW